MNLYKSVLWLSAAVLFLNSLSCKKSDKDNAEPPEAVELLDNVVAENLNFPWDMVWGNDGHIWMTERSGKISRFNPATGQVTPVITIAEVVSNGEGGMLGLALSGPAGSPNVFVVYNYNNGGQYREKLVRYSYNGTTLVNPTVLLDNIAAASIHNGSRLVIDNDKIFMSTGDASQQSFAQNINSVNGKILRLNLDGSVPADNPVPGNPYWSSGHRNAQGLVMANGKLYSSEHGPSNDDEINIIQKGKNYGWPVVQGYCNSPSEQSVCASTEITEPIKAWTPTIAASGLDYYNHDLIPQWKGSLLLVALKDALLLQLKLGDDLATITQTNEYFTQKYGRMRDVCVSPEGKVYICTSNGGNNDKIIEIRAKS
jgi:glucose/arabinose dehydrogenase